jgi:hypothetical protein
MKPPACILRLRRPVAKLAISRLLTELSLSRSDAVRYG